MAVIAVGREEKLFAVTESAYGAAAAAAAAGNAVRFRTLNIDQKIERIQRDDKRSTRSYLETVVRRKSVAWSISGYLLPGGALGTAPDGWDDILEAGFGIETVNASTSVVYTLAKEFSNSVTLHRAVGAAAATDVFSEMVRGCVVDRLSFTLGGNTETMITASGFGADVLRAGTSTVNTDSGTSLVVASGDGTKFDAGMYIDVDVISGVLISAVSTDTLTVASHTAQSNGELVSPSACNQSQTFTSTAHPISGILGSASIGGSSHAIISAQIDLDNGAKGHNDRFGSDKVNDYHFGNRRVSGSVVIRLDSTTFNTVAKTKNATTQALSLVSGTTAGSIATFTLGQVMFDYSMIPSNPVDDILVTLPFIAYGSSGEDELSLTLT